MPAERIPMRKVRDTLRLRHAGLTLRQIAASLRISVGSVSNYLSLAALAGFGWPLPDDLDDESLERALFRDHAPPLAQYAEPDFAYIHQQLKRKGVTMRLLWEEYKEAHPHDGYQFTRFCHHVRAWQARLKTSMRQTHHAGDKLFVDYAGKTVPILVDGLVLQAQIFVAVLGASNYTYAEATWTQALPDWIGSHVRALAFIGGVPALIVSDNLRSGVAKPHRYEPEANRTYEDLARHYGTALLPARPRRPRDKAKVEIGVQVVERWILARLRNRQFFSLSELNAAIRELLSDLNARQMRKLPGSRLSLFETLERDCLRPLPPEPFEYCEWNTARVGIDYHVEVDRHYYSVPSALTRRQVDLRVTAATVEVFHGNRRVASHVRSRQVGGHSTHAEHMPKAHRAHAEWSPARLLAWASEVGAQTAEVVSRILEAKPHPEQGYRACLGLQRLARRYTPERLEAACRRTLAINAPSYLSVESILKLGLDRIPMADEVEQTDVALVHENVRGADYYRRESAAETEVPVC